MPLMRLTMNVAPASTAPVLPAEMNTSAFFSATSSSATTSEESFLRRTAMTGGSQF
jgi:hypothetical protein